jgi:uncharacterized protein YceK
MPTRLTGLIIAIVALFTAGCGTVANMNGSGDLMINPMTFQEPKPFGGVVIDAHWASERVRSALSPDGDLPVDLALAGYVGVVDLPLSLVGDTLTLPKILQSPPHDDHHTRE